MLGNILEISKRASKGGRVPIKIALLKIHKDVNETNKNGLHWKEEYVLNAIDSVKFMPICASFCDETKSTPLDHGMTGEEIDSDGVHEPLFENSETVGCFENANIENVTVNGNEIRALVANGFLYNQRYPAFVKWVRANYAQGTVDTSIELMGLDTNDNKIVYEEDNPTDEFRTPKEFVFSGSCILSVQPADADAIVLEIAQKQSQKEDKTLDENKLKELIQSAVSEISSKNDELNTKIAELNTAISDKEAIIAEKDGKIVELNASIQQLQDALTKLKQEHDTYWAERELLEKELVKAKVAEKLSELDSALSEFNEDEKASASDDIKKLKENINSCEKKDDLKSVSAEINSIRSKICMDIVAKQKKAEQESKTAEQNSAREQKNNEVIDIFSEMCSDTQDDDEDINIF